MTMAELLWMIVLGAALEAMALGVWIARDAFTAARRPAFKWANFKGKV